MENEEPQNDNLNGAVEAGGETPAENAESAAATTQWTPNDALLERAVKAGMSLADAKMLPSADFADRIIAGLEGASSTPKDGGESPRTSSVDLSAFTEENGYDPNIIKALKSMNSVILAQQREIASLSNASRAQSPKAAAVEARKNLVIHKPGGDGKRPAVASDPEADIVNELRQKFKLQ